MRVRFTQGQLHYDEVLVVNRGDFQMASIMVDPNTGLHDATAFDWSKGPPYTMDLNVKAVSLKEARKAVKDYLEALPEPLAY